MPSLACVRAVMCVTICSIWPLKEVKKNRLSFPFGVCPCMSGRKTYHPGPQTEIDSPQPYLGDSMNMIGSQGTLRRRRGGRPDTEMPNLLSTDGAWACLEHRDP